MPSLARGPSRFVTSVLVLLLVPIGAATAQESASFSVERTTMTAAGQSVGSMNYESILVAGQVSPSGAASFCNASYVSSFGFFSVLGDLPVPIRLQVGKHSGDPTIIDLFWTGTADVFQVYRSLSPQDVLEPENLEQETARCDGSDSPGTDRLVFYEVIAAPAD